MSAGVTSTVPAAADDTRVSSAAWERRRRLIRRDIEDCALEVLASRGYDDVSTDDLATAAGVSTRTFFRYFPTKEDILMAMPLRVAEALCANVVERPHDETLLEAWRAVATGATGWPHADDMRSARQAQRIIARSPGFAERITRNNVLLAPFVHAVATRLDVDPETDLRPAVYGTAIQGALQGALRQWAGGEGASLPALFAEALDLLTDLPTASGARPAQPARPARRAASG
jgi:AcrR family transcriptional regulator